MNKKNYKFDLEKLENNIREAYKKYLINDTSDTRTNIYVTIKELAYAILLVNNSYKELNIDYEQVSYEYSLYMFERIIIGTFVPKATSGNNFPWQVYISKNIKHIIYSIKDNDIVWKDLISDLSSILDNNEDFYTSLNDKAPLPDSYFNIQSLSVKLYEGLRIYFTDEEIKNNYNLVSELIFCKNRNHSFISKNIPNDLQDFAIVLISLAKRLTKSYNINFSQNNSKINLKKAFKKSIRSTIFLSTITNTNIIPKELLLTLDIDTLYRLIYVSGGQFIRIPTIKEIDSLVAAVVAVSKVILENKTIDRSIYEAKNNFDLVLSNKINIQYFISKIIESYNFDKQDQVKESDPLINIVIQAIKSLEYLLPKIIDKAENESPEFLLNFYSELSSSMNFLTDSLTKIDKLLDGGNTKNNKLLSSFSNNE